MEAVVYAQSLQHSLIKNVKEPDQKSNRLSRSFRQKKMRQSWLVRRGRGGSRS
jgi:hypothetical protein